MLPQDPFIISWHLEKESLGLSLRMLLAVKGKEYLYAVILDFNKQILKTIIYSSFKGTYLIQQ